MRFMILVKADARSDGGARVRLGGGKPAVIDGSFAEAKELIGGFWMFQVKLLCPGAAACS